MTFDATGPTGERGAQERELCCFFGMRRMPLPDIPQLQPTVFRPSGKHPRLKAHPTPCC